MTAKTKHPIEPDNYKRFKVWVIEMAEMYGVVAAKDVQHHVALLVEAVDRAIYETENKRTTNTTPIRRFIAMFHNHYRILTDYEYGRRITGVENKTIESLVTELTKVNCDVEDYLKWFFEAFLPNNEKMCPPTIGLACSKFSLGKFLYEHKDEIRRRENKAVLYAAERDLYSRSKALFGQTNDSKIRIWSEQYRAGSITL
jgi:hypothetical protein